MNNLKQFIKDSTKAYNHNLKQVPLFHPDIVLDNDQIQKFVLCFYHARGHFDRFLWILGSFAPAESYKKIIIQNISEEFGGRSVSHEQLYIKFAQQLGVNILGEIISEENYSDFLREFNQGHIDWLLAHDWVEKWGAFAAYESLDNTDYENLLELVSRFSINAAGLGFFKVHANAGHFESTFSHLEELWESDSEKIKQAFEFILDHQLKMWNNLSNSILKL